MNVFMTKLFAIKCWGYDMKQYKMLISVIVFALNLLLVTGCVSSQSVTPDNQIYPTMVIDLSSSPDPEDLPVNVTPLATILETFAITPTPTQVNYLDFGRLVFARYGYYGWFDLMVSLPSQGYKLLNDPYQPYSMNQTNLSPRVGDIFSFSHYSDQVAYWAFANPAEVWVSSITAETIQQVVIDPNGIMPKYDQLVQGSLKLSWSPDDLYLFIRHKQIGLNYIYNMETGVLQEWLWECNGLILSEHSSNVATWCQRFAEIEPTNPLYAVIEWGGEIWYSESIPGRILLEPLPGEVPFLGWSANGQLIAYMSPLNNHLTIVDLQGNQFQELLPGISLFQNSYLSDYQQYELFNGEQPIIWSREAAVLLVYGFGETEHTCPFLISIDTQQQYTQPCWQAINTDTKEVIWSESDLITALYGNDGFNKNTFLSLITISPNGQGVAAQITLEYPTIAVVDLNTGRVLGTLLDFDRFNTLYWTIVSEPD